jgi:hypothetical protein
VRRVSLLGIGVAALIAGGGGLAEAATKHYCCYRVDVRASGSINASWNNQGEPGGANGTYDLTWNWATRELMEYSASQPGTGAVKSLDWIRNRNGRVMAKGWSRFFGREESNQSRNDANGQPEPYGPCSFNYGVPWGRTKGASRPSVSITGSPGETRGLDAFERTGSYGPFWINRSGCNNNVPFYSPDGGFAVSTDMGRDVTDWDTFGATIHPLHTNPRFKPGKLKKLKDYDVAFGFAYPLPPPEETDDPRFDHTGTAPVSIKVTFKHFHRDRIQKEINRGDELNTPLPGTR